MEKGPPCQDNIAARKTGLTYQGNLPILAPQKSSLDIVQGRESGR
jgi:hypothetical protein